MVWFLTVTLNRSWLHSIFVMLVLLELIEWLPYNVQMVRCDLLQIVHCLSGKKLHKMLRGEDVVDAGCRPCSVCKQRMGVSGCGLDMLWNLWFLPQFPYSTMLVTIPRYLNSSKFPLLQWLECLLPLLYTQHKRLTFELGWWTIVCQSKVESAAQVFAQQLDTAHKGLCAWKNNSCPDTLAQLPPAPLSTVLGAYIDQCETLLQLYALLVISESIINQMFNHGSQVD
jgi:hypothetical protein